MNKRFGFTLVELLIVIMIIGILATMAVPQYQKMVDKAKCVEAWTTLHAIWQAEERYYLEYGTYALNDIIGNDYDFLTKLDIENPMLNPSRKFNYYFGYGHFIYGGPTNDMYWNAVGVERSAYGGPDIGCALVHYPDGHVERYVSQPYASGGNFKKID